MGQPDVRLDADDVSNDTVYADTTESITHVCSWTHCESGISGSASDGVSDTAEPSIVTYQSGGTQDPIV
jgi:hypothetical protein